MAETVTMKPLAPDPNCPLCLSGSTLQITDTGNGLAAKLNVVLGNDFRGGVVSATMQFTLKHSHAVDLVPPVGPPLSAWVAKESFLITMNLPTWLIAKIPDVKKLFAQLVVTAPRVTLTQGWEGIDG